MPLIQTFSGASGRGYGMLNKNTITPPPTSPTSGYSLWLDANDASTFTFSSGSVVSQWRDKSANAYAFNQSTVANQPTRTGTQNSKSTLVFDGVNDALVSSAVASTWKFLHSATGATVFCVAKETGTTANQVGRVLSTVNFGVTTDVGISVAFESGSTGATSNITSNFVDGTNGATSYNFNSSALASHAVVTTVFDPANATSSQRILIYINNGSPDFTTATATSSTANPSTTLWIGNDAQGYRIFKGEIAEILIYPSVLSATNRNLNITYLKNKWNI